MIRQFGREDRADAPLAVLRVLDVVKNNIAVAGALLERDGFEVM